MRVASIVFAILGSCAAAIGCGGCGDEPIGEADAGCVDCRSAPDVGPMAPDLGRTACVIGATGGFCHTDYCRVTVEPDTVADEVAIELREQAPPRAVASDIVGHRVCAVNTAAPVALRIAVRYEDDDIPEGFVEEELLGARLSPLFESTDAAHDRAANEFLFTETTPAEVAVSALPAAPRVSATLGVAEFDAADPAAYLRNVSAHPFRKAFHDGRRLYLGNGPRLLIWNDGVPSPPTRPPDVVLGRRDLAAVSTAVSASSFSDAVRGIWSDGTRLAVSEGHRVLIWNRIPTVDFAPADVVLGQSNFGADKANQGRTPDESTLNVAGDLWSDGTRFVVADTMNNRFLVWNEFPVVTNQPADVVVGQPSFTETARSAGAMPIYRATGFVSDGAGAAFSSEYACNCVQLLGAFPASNNLPADYQVGEGGGARVRATSHHLPGALSRFGASGLALRNGYRVSAWTSWPEEGDDAATYTLGRPDALLGAPFGRLWAATLGSSSPNGDVFATDELMIATDDRRVLVWRTVPGVSFQQADAVIGQPSAATNEAGVDYRGISARTLAAPADVSTAGDVTVVADRANNRVLVLRGDPAAPQAITVLGQVDGRSFAPNEGWASPGAATLNSPAGVFTDGSRVFVADAGNHRVLVWRSIPTVDGAPADLVLGQPDFVSVSQNAGLGDGDGDGAIDAGAATLHFPSDVAYDGRLLVADTFNHRVLVWDALPVNRGAPADRVLGQPDMTQNAPNRGLSWYARGGDTLAAPSSLALAGDGRLAIADSENNRVVIYPSLQASEATVVLGQPDLAAESSPNWLTGFNVGWPTNPATQLTTAATLRRPMGVAWTSDGIVVADTGNHRVLTYADPQTSGLGASAVIGQATMSDRAANAGGLGPASLDGAEGVAVGSRGELLVADTGNHRLVVRSETGAAVFGQLGPERNGINGSAPATDRVDEPGGIAVTKDQIWLADRAQHRVLAFRDQEITAIVGQPDLGGAQANAGLAEPAGWTLDRPSDVWTDGRRLVIADAGNHRVLIWDTIPTEPGTPADVVVGQRAPNAGEPNAGRGVSRAGADGLLAPEGVLVAGEALYVADTGNSRVLVFDPLPTSDGAAATRVLCQDDFESNGPNRGAGEASAASCSGPTDVLVVGDRLFVADALNHRVLEFPTDAASGAAAVRVLGQPDFQTRQPYDAEGQPTARIFATPWRLAHDGTNFYVADRGHHRVLIYDSLPTTNFAPADRLLGQVSFDVAVVTPARDGLDSPSGLGVLPQPFRSARVYVADAGKDRVIEYVHVARPF